MLTISYLRNNTDEAIQRLQIKNIDARDSISAILNLDDKRKAAQTTLDNCLAALNNYSKEIGILMKQGKADESAQAKQKAAELSDESKVLRNNLVDIEKQIDELIVKLPNVPHISVPKGRTPEDNVVVRSGGQMPVLPENAKPHWDLITQYDIIDFELGNKLTGAGFPVYKGKGAKLQRALISFFLDNAIDAGYREVIPPLLVNEASGFGTGQLPDKEGQMYHATADNYYLIPTAEVPVTNIFRDEIVAGAQLPIKYTAYTPCFRREAGAWGRDVRGLNRLHQFDKVEIVQVANPEGSYDRLEEMVSHVESIVQKLGLPYRILKLCGGDMSFTSSLTYDFEVYSAAQQRWLEVSSVSNFETFQANRLKLRYRDEATKKTALAHTLNGSALALPRIVAAILENNQTDKGIKIPEILVPYTRFEYIN